ncbi:MAG: SdrD B-like domain-containing protein [Thiobacillus sp.]|nr:SdrD B-like domain-containing protein [Thiobacillus sp.]
MAMFCSVLSRIRMASVWAGIVCSASVLPGIAWADLGASVTLAVGQPANIYPGEITQLQITLSNNNTTATIASVGFSNSLPGVLPNGLKIAGAPTYSCTDPAGPTLLPGSGTLTANLDSQSISLVGGVIPARASSTDGTCIIILPVTAGTSAGAAATHTYTIASGAVTGNDGGAVANVGAVSQSVNVQALNQPAIAKSFSNSTAILGGAARTLSVTLTNTNPVAITGFSITDAFPQLSGQAIIRVANPAGAVASCNNGGGTPTFTPSVGDTTISATGTIPARVGAVNGSCTLTVNVEAAHSNGVYTTGAQANTINAVSQFGNDQGIRAASNASANITVRSPLRVSKAVNASSLATGQAGFFTLTLFNDGDTPLSVNSLTDSPIDGVLGGGYGLAVTGHSTTCAGGVTADTAANEGVTLSGGTIPANGSCTVTINFTGTVQTADTPSSYTNSLAQGAVDVGNAAIVSQAASAAVTVYENLNVSKAVSPVNAAPGNPVRYDVTVQNWSTSDIADVVISETLTNGQTYLTGVIGGIDYAPTLSGTGCSGLTPSGALGTTTPTFTVGNVPQRSGVNTPGACTVRFWAMTATGAANGAAYANSLGAGSVCYAAGSICNGGGSNSAGGSINATVLAVAKTFSQGGTTNPPSALARPEGTIVRMAFTLTNLSANSLSGLAMSDTLPVSGGNQLRIANPANAASTCGSPVITAVPGSTSFSLNGGSVPARAASGTGAAGTCVVQVDVVGAAGTYNNTATATATESYANGSTHVVNAASNTATVTFTSALSATKSFNPAAVSSGGRSTVTLRLNNSGAVALTNVAAVDPLPSGMSVANPPNAYSTCAGATSITVVAGASSASLSGASIAGGGSCDFIFDVIATGGANWVNTLPAGNITADGSISNQTPVSATLTNNPATGLTIAKSTLPSTLTFPGQVSQLTLTLSSGTQAVSNLALTDYFTTDGTPGAAANGMRIASTPAASTTCPSGSVSAVPDGTQIALTGATLAASTSCTVTVNVTSQTVGGITNFIPAGAITTNQGLTNSGQASTSLTTQSNVGIAKQFSPNVVQPGQRSRLRITFFNPISQPVSNLTVTDTLPAGVTVPGGANPATTCSGASVTSPAAGQVQVSGASLAGASGGIVVSCYAEIDVLVAAQGDYLNTIPAGAITATAGGAPVTNSQPASDTLRAKTPLVLNKAIANQTLDAGNPGGFTTGTAARAPGAPATLTIRLANSNSVALTSAAFTDSLPSGLVVANVPNVATTCAGGVVTAAASATQVRLNGATIPANGACTVTVDVLSNISGSYTNTLAAGSVTSFEGVSNEEPTRATLVVSTPPTVDKQFAPAVIPPNGLSQLTIVLGNSNASAATLTSVFTDTLPTAPGAMVVATPNGLTTTCPGAVTATAGSGSVSYANGASVPAGGCSISLNVTATVPGDYTNNIPAGGLATSFGSNQQPTNVVLKVSTLGFISGRVFADNNLTPNGIYDGTDAPLAGSTIELRSGASCAGALLASTSSDALGNYQFASLAAGTYSVCQTAQPGGTANGMTTAGSITPINGSSGSAGTSSNPTATSSQIVGIVLNGDGAGGEISGSPNNSFAEVRLSSIAGSVFMDQNNNGVQNGLDGPLAGVSIELLDGGGSVVATTTSDAAGAYRFDNLQPGTYSVREPIQPADSSNGIATAGAVGNGGTAGTATASTTLPSRISNIVLPPDTAAEGNDFAEIPNGRALLGQVFLDYDNNGTLNGIEYGLGNQTLNLTGTDVNGNSVNATTLTAADGRYSFTGLPEGTYSVTQPMQPTGTTNGITTAGSTGGTATAVGVAPSVISAVSLLGTNLISANNDFAEVPGAAPDLTISKSHTPSSFASNSSTGVFTLLPANVGSVATSGTITVVDTLPAGMTVAAPATGTGWTCVGAVGASSVSCTSTDSIAAGGSGNPLSLRVAVAAGLTGQILVNSATVSGGGEPPGFTGNNTANDSVPIADAAQVSGTVWTDIDHDRVLDAGEPRMAGWLVDLLLNGALVRTATTDANGTYQFTGLAPGSGYSIQFRDPDGGRIWGNAASNETGVTPVSGTRDTGSTANAGSNAGNPAGAVFGNGTLASLTLIAGDNIVQQSLPLDPSGVVYDAITRNPVPGATVSILNAGVAVPGACLVGGTNAQVTGVSGSYQFLLVNPAPPGCPGSGTYVLQVLQPGTHLPPPSALIPPAAGTHVPVVDPGDVGVDDIQEQAAAPTGAQDTTYYMSFALTLGGVGVVNNHIPLDPVLGGAIVLTKTTPLVNVGIGQLVPYTITARNTLAANLTNIDIRDTVPPGFKYKPGSAAVDGVALEPQIGGRVLTWANLTLAAGATRTVKLLLVVGAGVQPGEYVNSAQAFNNLVPPPNPNAVSNIATATVRVIPDPLFDCSDLIGKVFDDQNANGYQDEGEPGIANVRLATARGWLVTTDAEGRFHVACAAIPDADRGSNFIMKLDERTLPSGYRVTTENPRDVRLTRGKLSKLNFGATIHKVVRVDMSDAAFEAGKTTLKPEWAKRLEALPGELKAQPSVLRLGYKAGAEGEDLARERLRAISLQLKDTWKQNACCHTLLIEEELFLPGKASSKEGK